MQAWEREEGIDPAHYIFRGKQNYSRKTSQRTSPVPHDELLECVVETKWPQEPQEITRTSSTVRGLPAEGTGAREPGVHVGRHCSARREGIPSNRLTWPQSGSIISSIILFLLGLLSELEKLGRKLV